MKRFKSILIAHPYITVFCVAVLYYAIMYFDIPIVGYFILSPLIFHILQVESLKSILKIGLTFGASLGIFTMFWAIDSVSMYTDSVFMGVLGYILGILIYAILHGGLFLVIKYIIIKCQIRHLALKAIIILFIWLAFEILLSTLFDGMPYFVLYTGYLASYSNTVLQWGAIGGMHLISFWVLLINIIWGYYLYTANVKSLYALTVLPLVYVGGILIKSSFEKSVELGQKLEIALLTENTPATTKWNEHTAPALIHHLLEGLDQAIKLNPDLILWTESAVPWTYDPNDDFINEVKKKSFHIPNLIGINTAVAENSVYNSAYLITPNEGVVARYDKQYLLDLVERSLFNMNLPFLGNKSFQVLKGEYSMPVDLDNTKLGVLICNETNISTLSNALVNNGIGVILALSNDAWFANSDLIKKYHFKQAQIRAIEQRKTVVVNSNLGYCGVIDASGEVQERYLSDKMTVRKVKIYKNNYHSFYNKLRKIIMN